MTRVFKIYKRFDAQAACKVEAGLVGVRDVRWPGRFESESRPARKDNCVHRIQQRDWSEQAQLEFLTGAYNKVRDLFNLPRADTSDTRKLVRD